MCECIVGKWQLVMSNGLDRLCRMNKYCDPINACVHACVYARVCAMNYASTGVCTSTGLCASTGCVRVFAHLRVIGDLANRIKLRFHDGENNKLLRARAHTCMLGWVTVGACVCGGVGGGGGGGGVRVMKSTHSRFNNNQQITTN